MTSARATATRRTRSTAKKSRRTSTRSRASSPLFDNFYDDGTLSADGHDWLVQADDNDYHEGTRRVGCAATRAEAATRSPTSVTASSGTPPNGPARRSPTTVSSRPSSAVRRRSPVEGMVRRLADHGGQEQRAPRRAARQIQLVLGRAVAEQDQQPRLPAVRPRRPDQYRVDIWEKDFNEAEKTGNLPNLTIMSLPDDHTGGVPDPRRSPGRRQRPGRRPDRRRHLPQSVLEELGDLRRRGRHPGRHRPRRRPPRPALDRQPVRQARTRSTASTSPSSTW